jgi:LuxR family transcriptional regulator, quorum-sensing system regulator RaiR
VQEELEEFLERLQTTTSIDQLQPLIHELRDLIKVDHLAYYWVNNSETVAAVTYDPRWVARYVEQDYKRIDPVVLGALRRFHPMDWKSLDWTSPAARRFFNEALEYGLGNQGYSVPIWGPTGEFALFNSNHSTSDAEWDSMKQAHGKQLLLLSHLFHEQARRIKSTDADTSRYELSPRERDALSLLSRGKSRAEVAESLKISENTLRAYIDSARGKLGAMNTTHAVALALARGAILP